MNMRSCRRLAAIGIAAATVFVGAPLAGWPSVVRLPAILVPALLLAALAIRPWRASPAQWESAARWMPSPRTVWIGALTVAAALFWIVLTRFQSAEINAVDFTVYFDRPCFQTLQGRPLFVETADVARFSWQSALEHHAYWGMFAACSMYAIHATPLWLLALSAAAVTIGAVYVLRIMGHLGAPGVVAIATALAFVLNDNTARTLNYGFHPEVLYAWFIPWLLHAALTGHPRQFAVAVIATILVKEDAVLPLVAVSVALALNRVPGGTRMNRAAWLLCPVALAGLNLAAYYGAVIPALTSTGVPAYAHFWAAYGPTPVRALAGMAAEPLRLAGSLFRTEFFTRVIVPHLYLPLVGWRWTIGVMPTVMVFGASDDPQLRAIGIYYSILLMPFLVIGGSTAALRLAPRLVRGSRAPWLAAAAILGGAVLVGSGDRGYSLRPWRPEPAAVREALSRLRDEPGVLVQSALYPHAGYSDRVQLLTPDTLRAPEYAGAALLLAPALGAYPFEREDIERLARRAAIGEMPGGLRAVRRPEQRRHDRHAGDSRHRRQ